MKIEIGNGYVINTAGVGVNILRIAGGLQPFAEAKGETGLPVRVQVRKRRLGELETVELFERDFEPAECEQKDAGLVLRGRHRGLRLTHELRWDTVPVGAKTVLRVARRLGVKIEAVLFTAPEYLRLLAFTRWGGVEKDKSFELSCSMSWQHHRSMREGGRWKYFAWNTPYMYSAEGAVCVHEGYMPTDVHSIGMAEYTALSWPQERLAVMVAIDPVEYLERNINPDRAQTGPAEAAFLGWFEPEDCGAEYFTPWQHYYFLEDEADPFAATAAIWREEYARRLNPYLQPESELEPWFVTEKHDGPLILERHSQAAWPNGAWDGNLTALEEHFAALRRDPLARQIQPLLVHERPGFDAICTNKNQYYWVSETPAGCIRLNVPLYHQVGDRLAISCQYEGKLDEETDVGLELALKGACFRFESAAISPFQRGREPAPDILPEKLEVRQAADTWQVRLEHGGRTLKEDLAKTPDYPLPIFYVRFKVMREIRPEEGEVDVTFLFRRKGETEWQRFHAVGDQEIVRGAYRFPPEPYPVRVSSGLLPTCWRLRMEGYGKPSIFFEVRDGRPVRYHEEEVARRLGALLRRYNVALSVYVGSGSMRNYDFSRNANYLIPNVLALDENRRPRPVWHVHKHRSYNFCPVCQEHNRRLEECLKQLLAWGPYHVYYDELCGNAGSCFSRDHGHGLCQIARQSQQLGDLMRRVAREAGCPSMYIGTENGNLLQHTFAPGHNFEGVDPSRKDENFEEIKRLLLGQLCYDFPGSRAYFNYVFANQPMPEVDAIYGHALGLAFPRFSLAPHTRRLDPVASFFAAAVKRHYPAHYRAGQVRYPPELVRPGAAPLATLALRLESAAGLSVHLANLSGQPAVLAEAGYAVELGHGCALVADSFGNLMGRIRAVRWQGAPYVDAGREVVLAVWRTGDGTVYLRVLDPDQRELRAPATVFLSKAWLARAVGAGSLNWQALDAQAAGSAVEVSSKPDGVELVYPSGPACRCLEARPARAAN